jgi:phage-related protein
MSPVTYTVLMNPKDKPIIWLSGEVKTPPLSNDARIEAGYLLRCLQAGISLAMPYSRPMPSVGRRCHELRINDGDSTWRILYRIDPDAIVILEVFQKKTSKTPKSVLEICRQRMQRYDSDSKDSD